MVGGGLKAREMYSRTGFGGLPHPLAAVVKGIEHAEYRALGASAA